MQTVLLGGRVIDVQNYQFEIGRPKSHAGAPPVTGPLTCRICHHPMSFRAGSTSERVPHFFHLSGAATCPSSIAASKQYSVLKPTSPNVAGGIALRAIFKATWRVHWFEFNRLTDHGSVDEFVEMLERACRLKLWEYRGIGIDHLPYLLVALADFPRANSIHSGGTPQRRYYLRFWFDGASRTLEGRWNSLASPPALQVAEFIDSGVGNRPTAAAVVRVTTVPMSSAFLSGTRPPGHFVVTKMAAFFKKHPKLFP
jgi:hypothetical protein